MKKILLIIGGFILIGVGFFAWYFFLHNPTSSISEEVRNILPFGEGGDAINSADNDQPEEVAPENSTKNLPRLFRLSDVPVSGAVGIIRGGSEFIRYVDRATGHIYDVNPVTLEKIKIANITRPKVYEAIFKQDGSGVIYRMLENDSDQITTLAIDLIPPKSTSTNALYSEVPNLLRGDIQNIAINPSGKISYITKDTGEIFVSPFNGVGAQSIFKSDYSDWQINWRGTNLTLSSKGSAYVSGDSYSLNLSGVFTKLKGPLNGLNLLRNPSETQAIYSYNSGILTKTFFVDLKDRTELPLSQPTFIEKCVWSNKTTSLVFCAIPSGGIENNEPDLWYQGRSHYSDSLWKINTDTDTNFIILEPKKDFNIDIDVINPFLSVDENYLVFTNKNDLSLWALKLGE